MELFEKAPNPCSASLFKPWLNIIRNQESLVHLSRETRGDRFHFHVRASGDLLQQCRLRQLTGKTEVYSGLVFYKLVLPCFQITSALGVSRNYRNQKAVSSLNVEDHHQMSTGGVCIPPGPKHQDGSAKLNWH